MVGLTNFYDKVRVFNDERTDLGRRLRALLDDVVLRLPDEEQFHIAGSILLNEREMALEFWQDMANNVPLFRGFTPDFTRLNRDGNCTFSIGETIEDSAYIVTIIVDRLGQKSDDYIKGLIIHELAEMSHMWRLVRAEIPLIMKMKPETRQIRLDQLGKGNALTGSKEHEEHENVVNNEAIRLGFAKEIEALEHLP